MPVLKIPIIHKFGIISHCQRLQLQSRLLTDFDVHKTDNAANISKRNQVELSEEFIDKYNSVITSDEIATSVKDQMKDVVNKIFLKNKRRVGLQFNCEDQPHINVALSWTELTILSQCIGDISDKSLDLIFLSLSMAPISQSTFLVQFYLLETALYFLQTAEFQATHSEKHVKWLQIGELAAVRIYVQCKLQLAQCHQDNLDNLKLYMKDIDKCQNNFSAYPEASISFCVIHELTEYLVETYEKSPNTMESQTSEHGISSLLWHCTDLWRCAFYSSHRPQIHEAVSSIQDCLMHNNAFGSWLDCYVSLRILASGACFERVCLDTLESVILGLTEVNAEMEDHPPSRTSQPEESQSNISYKICGYEKGTLLLFTALREFSCIPLFCRKSAEREQSLSTIAQWLLHFSPCSLPKAARKIIVSRMKSILVVIELVEKDARFSVMKNAVWSLLEAVQRKRILQGDIDDSLMYGSVVSSLMFSPELPATPDLINEKLSVIMAKNLFPLNPTSQQRELQVGSLRTIRNINKNVEMTTKKNIKSCIATCSKQSVKRSSRTSGYNEKFDKHLQEIMKNLWVADLPNLEKTIDESSG